MENHGMKVIPETSKNSSGKPMGKPFGKWSALMVDSPHMLGLRGLSPNGSFRCGKYTSFAQINDEKRVLRAPLDPHCRTSATWWSFRTIAQNEPFFLKIEVPMKMKQSTELAMFGKKNVYVKNHRSRSCNYIILYIYTYWFHMAMEDGWTWPVYRRLILFI